MLKTQCSSSSILDNIADKTKNVIFYHKVGSSYQDCTYWIGHIFIYNRERACHIFVTFYKKKTGAFQVSCKEKIQLEDAPRQIPMHHLQSFGKRRAVSAAGKLKSGSDLKTFNGDQINILSFNVHIWKIQQMFMIVLVKIQIIANIFWHYGNKEVIWGAGPTE